MANPIDTRSRGEPAGDSKQLMYPSVFIYSIYSYEQTGVTGFNDDMNERKIYMGTGNGGPV